MKNLVFNVSFGDNCTFQNIDAITTSSVDKQMAAFGRKFPMRATKEQLVKRVNEQLEAIKAWKTNLRLLQVQLEIEELEAQKATFLKYMGEDKFIQMLEEKKAAVLERQKQEDGE